MGSFSFSTDAGTDRRQCAAPINDGNRKLIILAAFADKASHLHAQIAPWAKAELGLTARWSPAPGATRQPCRSAARPHKHPQRVLPALEGALPKICRDEGELDILIATDCISEGQNLQDWDWLINDDIHWNPVRIIQRFGRIGSTNTRIQRVNFWPNMELEEYINLEQRVSGRMVLLDISAIRQVRVL